METRKQDLARENQGHFDEKPTPMPDFRQTRTREDPDSISAPECR
jgi:hypothetical protein